jgi:hypothetical protein
VALFASGVEAGEPASRPAKKAKKKSDYEYHGPYSRPPGYPGQGWVVKKKHKEKKAQ